MKNGFIDKLVDIVHKYNYTHHSTIKLKPVNVKSSTYIDFHKKNNRKDPKFNVGDQKNIYKNIFAKGFIPNWSEECFVIKKDKML